MWCEISASWIIYNNGTPTNWKETYNTHWMSLLVQISTFWIAQYNQTSLLPSLFLVRADSGAPFLQIAVWSISNFSHGGWYCWNLSWSHPYFLHLDNSFGVTEQAKGQPDVSERQQRYIDRHLYLGLGFRGPKLAQLASSRPIRVLALFFFENSYLNFSLCGLDHGISVLRTTFGISVKMWTNMGTWQLWDMVRFFVHFHRQIKISVKCWLVAPNHS